MAKKQISNELWVHRDSMYYAVYGINSGPPIKEDKKAGSSIGIQGVVNAFSNAHEMYLKSYREETKIENIRDIELENKYKEFLADDNKKNIIQNILKQKGYSVDSNNIFKGIKENTENLSTARKILIDTLDNNLSIMSENQYVKTKTLRGIQEQLNRILEKIQEEIEKARSKEQMESIIQIENDEYTKKVRELLKCVEDFLGKDEKGEIEKRITLDDVKRGKISYMNNLITELNKTSIIHGSDSYIQGQIGEIIGAALGYIKSASGELIEKNVLDAVEKSSLGKEYVYIKRNQETGMIESEERSKKDFEAGLSFEYTETHVSKTDIIIKDKSNPDDKGIKQSIKNYSNFSKLSLVSNTPLSKILTVNKDKDFLYHYGNMLPRRYVEGHEKVNLDNYRKGMNDIIQKSALKIALMGYSKEIDIPDVFVVFNSKKQKDNIRIFKTRPLLNYLINNSKENHLSLGTYSDAKGKIEYDKTLDSLGISDDNNNNKKSQVENLFYNHKVHMTISVSAIS